MKSQVFLPTEFDPQVHEIVESDFIRGLRKDVRLPSLRLYRHKLTGLWVLAIFSDDGQVFFEVGYADSLAGRGSSPPNRRIRQEMVKRLTTMWRPKESLIKQTNDAFRDWCREQEEIEATYHSGIEGMRRYLRRTKGSHKSEQYYHNTGLQVVQSKKKEPDVFVGT